MVFLVKNQKYDIVIFPFSIFSTWPLSDKTDVPAHVPPKGSSSVESVQRPIASSSFSISVYENTKKRNGNGKKRKRSKKQQKGQQQKKTLQILWSCFLVMLFLFFLFCFACQNTPTSKLGSRFVLVRKFVKVISTLILLWDSLPAMVASFFGVVPHST